MKLLPLVGALLALAGLTACQTGGQTSAIPEPYSSRTIKLDVKEIPVVSAFDTASLSPADRATSDRLVSAVGAWARSMLAPAGPSGAGKVTVQNARIADKAEGQQITVDGVIDVRVEAPDRRTAQTVYADTVVRRQATLPATASAEERDRVRSVMAREMVNEIDTKLEGEVRRRMGSVILP